MLDLLAVPLICLLGGAAVFWQFKSLLLGLEALAASRQEGVLATVQPYVAAVSRGIKTIVGESDQPAQGPKGSPMLPLSLPFAAVTRPTTQDRQGP